LESTTDELARGTLFAGRYEIIEELGAGGMGRVYRAHDTKLNEEVALKLIKPEIAADKRTVERFRNEIKNARKISHPNVCRTHDLGEEGKALYLTMEYIRGEDLRSLIHRMKVLAVGSAVSVGRQIATGLAEAHKQGIVHRDLKPGNVMIDKDGQAKIMDFGIARSVVGGGITGEGAIIGTPEYMSPEQVEGKPADARADIYGLGIILFEMVTGRPPFEGETAFSIANKHKSEPAPDPRMLNPQIPEDLSRLILRCLEKERGSRYQATEELLADLGRIEASLPAPERVTTPRPSTKPKPPASKTITVKITPRKLLIPAASVALAIAAVLIWHPWSKTGTSIEGLNNENSIAVLPFTDLSPKKDQAAICEGIAETLHNSLANVKNLQVRGRYSSFQFDSRRDDPREIGRKLNVKNLLAGSYQLQGNRMRVTVQLINTADGSSLWSDKRDGESGDIFDIEDMIVSMTLAKLNVALSDSDKSNVGKRYTNNKEAYDLYLEGNYFARRLLPDTHKKAISLLLEAIKKDPAYVLPYIALAKCYKDIYIAYAKGSKADAYRLSQAALTKAFDTGEEIGEAYAIRASLKFEFENDPAGAEIDYQRALQLSPRNPVILEDHVWYLYATNRFDAAETEMKFLIELEPLSPGGYTWLAMGYYYSGRIDDALENFNKALDLDPEFPVAIVFRIATLFALGDYSKVPESIDRLKNTNPEGYIFNLTILEALTGKRDEAAKRKEANKEVFRDPILAAAYYAAIGDRDQLLSSLARFSKEATPSNRVQFLWPLFNKYRSDPEFIELMRKSGLEVK